LNIKKYSLKPQNHPVLPFYLMQHTALTHVLLILLCASQLLPL
jgi:hypothetical protein